MSDQETVSYLKKLLRKGRNAAREDDRWFEDRDLHVEIREALIDIGQEGIYELVEEVSLYLDDPFAEFRAEAVRTLGWTTRLGLDEFCKEQAFKIWEQDPDEEVKRAALSAWGGYYARTKNVEVLQELYNILTSKEYSSQIRAWALDEFLSVSNHLQPGEGYEILELGELKGSKEFDKAVDWKRVNSIMVECIPEWKDVIVK